MSGAELAPTDYLNPYSGQEARGFIQSVLKKMARMEKAGKYADAIEYCETQILYCTDVYGGTSPQTWKLCERFCATSNALAVAAVQQGSYNQPTKLLRRALSVLRRCSGRSTDPRQLLVRAVTLNNLGTHYRRTDRLRASLTCLNKAVALNPVLDNPALCADTHINVTATLSMLEAHAEAAEHAAQAIALLRIETALLAEEIGDDEALEAQWQQRSGVLAVTIYNHGVELESLGLDQAAIKAYREASRVCNDCFGPDHPTSVAMSSSYQNALETMGDPDELDSLASTVDFSVGHQSDRSMFCPPSEAGLSSHMEADEFVFDDDGASDGETHHPNNTNEEDELDAVLDLMPEYDELKKSTCV